jgi:hypothetical protein
VKINFKNNISEWIISIALGIIVFYYIILIKEIFLQLNNIIFKLVVSIILFISILFLFLDGFTSFSIEENLWEDFKRGIDYHIDKMVDSLVLRSKILFFLMILWLFIFLYFLITQNEIINIYKYLFISLAPVIINGYIIKNTYNISKKYNS